MASTRSRLKASSGCSRIRSLIELGICCSGGGIRSASFNLGALQAIQKAKRLQTAKYLAAVSGGSYIAAAFSLVAKKRRTTCPVPHGPDDSDPELVTEERPPFYEGSPEEQCLRETGCPTSPRPAWADFLLIWRIGCGLNINLLLVASVLALGAALLALYYRHGHPGLATANPAPDVHKGFVVGAALVAASGLVLGLVAVLLRPNREKVRQALELLSLYLVGLGVLGVVLEFLLPELIALIREQDGTGTGLSDRTATVVGGGVGASIVSIMAAVLLQLRARLGDPKEAIDAAKQASGWVKKLAPRLRLLVVNLATSVAGPLLLVGAFVAATIAQVAPPDDRWLWAVPAAATGVFVFLYFLVGDLTSWSLHPYYRRRLCTAFALKRVRLEPGSKQAVARERTQSSLLPLSESGVVPRKQWWQSPEWPTLVVCAAANISDPGATPPGRGVTSFTFSPFAIGGPLVGGIRTLDVETGLSERRWRDLTLPAAVAMSGAALSPSMGKLSRPRLRFLMALANVRLGVWVPNPRRMDAFVTMRTTRCKVAEGRAEKLKALVSPTGDMSPSDRAAVRESAESKPFLVPRPRPRYLLKELLGQNSINDKYLYVTDGGHYENLGLVELFRRGCTTIYCFDASGGGPMTNLGDALALARSELGVEVELPRGRAREAPRGR